MYSNNKQIRDVADVAARIMAGLPVTEKLHPNQQVLDVHEPEKDELTADDFKKLRAKKEVKKEEVELDESIKTTHENPLVTVHDKNGLHTHANLSVANDIFGTNVKHSDVHKGEVKTKSRAGDVRFNISKHHEKAMKEEVEQLDEIGNTPAGQAALKAVSARGNKEMSDWNKKPESGYSSTPKKVVKHSAGGMNADRRLSGQGITKDAEGRAQRQIDYAKKMRGEEVEQFDEAAKPNELHVVDDGVGRYKVRAVGSNHAHDIKVGEHLTNKHLDDFHDKGVRVMIHDYFDDSAKRLKHKQVDEAKKESKKDFDDRQKRLAAASSETAKDPERLKKLSKIPGYTAAMDLAKKTTKEEVEAIDEVKLADLPSRKIQGRAYGSSRPEPHAVDTIKGPNDAELKKIEAEKKKKKFSEMVNLYQDKGLKSLSEMLAKEESTEDEFNKELEDAKAKDAGKKKNTEIAKGAVQAVKTEETHSTVEVIDLNGVNGVQYSEIELAQERTLTSAETEKKEEIVKSMKKGLSGFKDRYGDRAKEVMYATATANAKKSS